SGISACFLRWRLVEGSEHGSNVTLWVRPLLCGRDYHALHHENPAFRFNVEQRDGWLWWHPYDSVPAVGALTNGQYAHEPEWYRNFLYIEEQARGLDDAED